MFSRFVVSNLVRRSLIVLCVVILCLPAITQENYLVSTVDGVLSVYDLATNSLVTSAKGTTGLAAVLPGPNGRLAFSPNGDYLSVVDTTIQREIRRLTNVNGLVAATTPDGKLLLVGGSDGFLRIIDTAQLVVVRQVGLQSILGVNFAGAVVVAGNKAYVFPYFGALTNVAVVDLTTYSVSSIPLPPGAFDHPGLAAKTPDGKTIVALEYEYGDNYEHVLVINTVTNTVVADYPQTNIYSAYALVVTPNALDPSKLFGYVAANADPGDEVLGLDLRANSPTYGQILSTSSIVTSFFPGGLAINSDGTRLVAVGAPSPSPGINTYAIDALKLITDPVHALVAQLAVDGGQQAFVACTGFFSTMPPGSAPVVSSVSGDITNDAAHDIQITGGNFQQGAVVRIGSMPPLSSTFLGSSTLSVTVPANAPARKGVDIIVTNPETNAPPDQQNQSGLLAGGFNILLNPKFQPGTQFATVNDDISISVFDLGQRQMINVPTTQWNFTPLWTDFNADGAELYVPGFTPSTQISLLPIRLSDYKPGDVLAIPGSHQTSSSAISASVDPTTGKPVVNVLWRASNDLHIGVVDGDHNSPTFNTFIRTFDAGVNKSGAVPYGIVTTADGKYSYMWYRVGSPYTYFLGIMNMSNGAFTQVSAVVLGINQADPNNGIRPVLAPDGKTLLLSSFYGNRWHIEIVDISKPTVPKRLAELIPVAIPGYGFPLVTSYQVVGNQLYGFDPRGVITVFNFNRLTGDFRERGWYIYPGINTYLNSATQYAPNFAFSPDGQWLYVADPVNDLIAVLDPTKLISGKDVVLTTIRAPYYPYRLAVSPVAPPSKAALALRPPER